MIGSGAQVGWLVKLSSSPWAIASALVGLAGGFLVGGWSLTGDFLLNWDQVIGPDIPLPPGVWGLGPELPRRAPFYIPLWLLSLGLPGPTVVGILLISATAIGVVGAARLVGFGPVGVVAGVVYGLSPFLLSRAAVGHLPVVVATALLPWLMYEIESRNPRSLFRWAVGFGLLGSSGAFLGLIPIGLALWQRGLSTRLVLKGAMLAFLSQASWVIPGVVAIAVGVPFPTSETSAFDLRVDGINGIARVVAGGGLFLPDEDVARRAGAVAGLLGLVLLGLGVSGLRLRSRPLHSNARSDLMWWVALVGAALLFVPAVPLLGDLWRALVSIGPFGVLRETQKFWPLLGLALTVGLAQILRAQCRDVGLALGVLVGALLIGSSMPGLRGAGGRLEAVEAPVEWATVTAALASDPGRVAVFPWRRYDALGLSKGRTVLQPGPWVLQGSILISADTGNRSASVERLEILEEGLGNVDAQIRAGQDVAPALRSARVDWVLVLNADEAAFYGRLGRESDVTQVVASSTADLYRIDPGPSQQPRPNSQLSWTGMPIPVHRVSGGESWDRSCERGWLVGFSPLERTKGTCRVPSSGGILWFPLAAIAILGPVVSLTAAGFLRPQRVTTAG